MPRTGGVYTLPNGYQAVTGEIIQPSQHNPPLEDLAQAMTDSLPRNGAAAMTGNLPMGNNRITGLAPATAPNHAARWDQVMPATGGTVTGIITVQRSGSHMFRMINSNYSASDFANISVTDGGALGINSAIPGTGSYLFTDSTGSLDFPGSVVTRGTGDSRYAPLTRTVSTGSGLTGGGNLSADRTLAVDGTVVRTSRQVNTGQGLSGGGNLGSNLNLSIALGSLPFTSSTSFSTPQVPIVDGNNSNTQGRQGPDAFKTNFNIASATTAITAGAGLTGGGNLSANRTINIGTPSSISTSSTNSASGTTHSHALPQGNFRDMMSSYIAHGQLGAYAFAQYTGTGTVTAGSTTSGGNLVPSSTQQNGAGTLSGTWRCMGHGNNGASTLWLRTS